jgi:transposase InsO family protein
VIQRLATGGILRRPAQDNPGGSVADYPGAVLSLAHADRAIGDWIGFYNNRRPHQALGMKTPAAAFELAA